MRELKVETIVKAVKPGGDYEKRKTLKMVTLSNTQLVKIYLWTTV